MKYSFMTFSTPELSLAEVLEVAREYGYDGIEPRLDAEHAHGIEVESTPAQRTAARQQAADAGIAIACLATSLQYADPAKTADMLGQTHERIDLAGDVGAGVMRVFGGQLPEGVGRDQPTDLLVESLSGVASHAAERGVILCLETHDSWCNPGHVAAVLRRVSHSAIAVNWDIMHPVRTGEASIDQSFDTLEPWIRHLHVHDGEGSALAPIGQGEIDHHRALELLLAINYEGFISGEWINWEAYKIHLPRELATLRRYEQELS